MLPDLRGRLPVTAMVIPPLAERRADILPLAQAFHQRLAADVGLPPRPWWSPASIRALLLDTWPRNVRQLLGRVQESLVHWDGDRPVEPRDFGISEMPKGDYGDLLGSTDLAAVARWALAFTNGAKGEAAALLERLQARFGDMLS